MKREVLITNLLAVNPIVQIGRGRKQPVRMVEITSFVKVPCSATGLRPKAKRHDARIYSAAPNLKVTLAMETLMSIKHPQVSV